MRRALPLAAAVLLAWLPFAALFGSGVPVARDLPYYFLPLKAHLAEALRAGTLPLVDRYRWGGSPLLGAPGAAPFDPLNLLFVLLPLGAAVKAWILIRVAAGVTGFALFARRRGLSPEGAAASGLLFGLSGPFVSFLPFLGASAAFSLLPWFALACERLLEAPAPRRVVPLALVSALLIVSGAPEFVLYAGLVALALLPGALRRDAALRQGGLLAAAALLAAALAAPAILTGLRAVSLSARGADGGMDRETAAAKAFPPARLAELAWDFAVADWRTSVAIPERGIPYPYLPSVTPGRVALLLALAGLAAGRRALPPLALALLGLLLALGPATPVWGAAARLFPPLLAIRYPEKHLALWGLGAAWLSVLGLRALEQRLGAPRRAAAAALLTLALLADRGATARGLMPTDAEEALHPPLLAGLPSALPEAPPLRLVALWEFQPLGGPRPTLDDLRRLFVSGLQPEVATLHGHAYLFDRDHDLLLPRQNAEWLRFLRQAVPLGSPLAARLLRTAGVARVVDWDGREMRLRALADPLPPYRFARRAVVEPDGRALFQRALREELAPETAYVSGLAEALPGSFSRGRVLAVRDRPDALSLTVEVAGPSPAFLLLYRRHDAMEEATIDGRPAPLSDVLFGFGGLQVPPGRHEVRLRPETRRVRIGALMTLLAIPLLAVLAARRHRP